MEKTVCAINIRKIFFKEERKKEKKSSRKKSKQTKSNFRAKAYERKKKFM